MESMRRAKKTKELATLVFLSFLVFVSQAAHAGIPEPGMVLYGKVFDASGSLVTSGELTCFYEAIAGGDPVVVTSPLREINGQGGPYSYKMMIPFEKILSGHPASASAIPLSSVPVEYIRVVSLNGTDISRSDRVLLSTANRGAVEEVTVMPLPEDSDGDGMADAFEQQIIDADPGDDIATLEDVLPDHDFDGDGESNLEEWQYGSSPVDPMSARRGDVDGDKRVSLADAIAVFKILTGMDAGAGFSANGDVNGDGKIGAEEALYISQKLSGLR
jgi:hypothetical protein